jgi:hypothetical protein
MSNRNARTDRTHYLLHKWILGLALPLALLTIVAGVWEFGLGTEEILSWKFLRVAGLTIASAVVTALALGNRAWRKLHDSGESREQ